MIYLAEIDSAEDWGWAEQERQAGGMDGTVKHIRDNEMSNPSFLER